MSAKLQSANRVESTFPARLIYMSKTTGRICWNSFCLDIILDIVVQAAEGGSHDENHDVVVAVLLVVGGLNWGLSAFFKFDRRDPVRGHGARSAARSCPGRNERCSSGAELWKAIQRRWHVGIVQPRSGATP
ncbi:MAG: DUF378 domain-containing protein [Candidatus Eisenbacteria bacterium]